MTSTAVNVLTAFLEARTGQQMIPERAARIDTMLAPLLRERHLGSIDALVGTLLRGRDPAIADQVVAALVNNETSFFRDPAVFDTVIEAIVAAAAGGGRVRILSAGCSTGQEPLSLAMALAERAETHGGPVPEIVASDVSEAALAQARAGRYSQFEIQRGLPIRRAMRWFNANADGDWIAKPELVRLVAYRHLNLAGTDWSLGTFDVILCRNVLLYLSPTAKEATFERLARALRHGGVLVLGAGETVIGQTRLFEPNATLRGTYRRAASARRAA